MDSFLETSTADSGLGETNNTNEEHINACYNATQNAIDSVETSDIVRRQTNLELRDMKITSDENVGRIMEILNECEEQVNRETVGNTKYVEKRMEVAREKEQKMWTSNRMINDVSMLEKKAAEMKNEMDMAEERMKKYNNDMDMYHITDQVNKQLYHLEMMEYEMMKGIKTDEESLEKMFAGAIDGLNNISANAPKLMEEAKQLAAELTVFKNAAANKNFYTMVAAQPGVASRSSSENATWTSEYSMSSDFPESTK